MTVNARLDALAPVGTRRRTALLIALVAGGKRSNRFYRWLLRHR